MKTNFYYLSFFALTIACFCATAISASPARRAFDTFPIDTNNVNSIKLPALANQNVHSVDATIKEVEALLHADPSLPRLTRGEILDIIENLTKSDVHAAFSGTITRDPKAIMVVLPYSADSAQNGDVQSLYTKPPVTHIIADSDEEIPPEKKKRRPTKKPYLPNGSNQLDYTSGVKIAKVPTTEPTVTVVQHFQSQQLQSEQTAIESVTQKVKTTTENPFTRFIRRRKTTTKIPEHQKQEFQDITTSTSTTTTTTTTTTTVAPQTTRKRKPTRRPTQASSTTASTITTTSSSPETFGYFPPSGINIIDPPALHQEASSQKPLTTKPTFTYQPLPTTIRSTMAPIMVEDVQIPEDFKEVLKSLDILIKQSPSSETIRQEDVGQGQLHLSDQDKLKLLFATLGGQTSTTSSTTTPEPDVVQVANNLSPEMQELLKTFGLIPDPNKDKTTTPKDEIFMEPSSVVSADSYSSFKPLPVATTNPDESMEDLLAKFGLVDKGTSNRQQKAIPMGNSKNQVNLDVIPDSLRHVIYDIGLKEGTLPDALPLQSDSQVNPTEPPKADHVFKPTASGAEYATQDEINRLNQLMSVIKQFEKLNGTTNEEDLKHIDLEGLKDLVNSFNVPLDEQPGPNPLDYDPGLVRNEVKRQTSTTVKPINPSLALLDSFGGNSDTVLASTETVTTSTTEPPKKTGFYYLFDWNSFLDIDNQKGKRVNLRFQPKVGDPKRFLSVNVP